ARGRRRTRRLRHSKADRRARAEAESHRIEARKAGQGDVVRLVAGVAPRPEGPELGTGVDADGAWAVVGPRYAAPGVMTVLAPFPAAAWAKASATRSSGKLAVTSRFTPSPGRRASARRKAVPRPNAPPSLSSR